MTGPATGQQQLWTTGQLAIAIGMNFGFTRTKRPNAAAAAKAFGVSPATIRRWINRPADSPPALSDERLTEIIARMRPTLATYKAQAIALQKAQDSLKQIRRAPKRGVLKSWKEQGWLSPYLVAVVEPFNAPIQQVTVSGPTEKALDHLSRRGRTVLETEVKTKFAALILSHNVLSDLDPWRVNVPTMWALDGRTQCWLPGAPLPDLDRMANQLKLKK